VAFAGWLPAALIGLAQAVALFLVLRLRARPGPVHPLQTLGTSADRRSRSPRSSSSSAPKLGPAGRLVALALLMLQLTSSGGTYPVETTPRFFQVIHDWLPMTYVVDGLRHLIDGGSAGTVISGSLVLAAFAAARSRSPSLAAWRGRQLSPSKLHPDLVM
jgi:putative membrane protein